MILDTNAVSALADGDPQLLAAAAAVTRFSLPVVVLGEFGFGIAGSRHRVRYAEWLRKLMRVSRVLLVDAETAAHYATVREELRDKGRPIPSNDVWIAALALQHHCPVLTRDEHFDLVDGVERRAW
jgi:predicted nucleic acid-binding protein